MSLYCTVFGCNIEGPHTHEMSSSSNGPTAAPTGGESRVAKDSAVSRVAISASEFIAADDDLLKSSGDGRTRNAHRRAIRRKAAARTQLAEAIEAYRVATREQTDEGNSTSDALALKNPSVSQSPESEGPRPVPVTNCDRHAAESDGPTGSISGIHVLLPGMKTIHSKSVFDDDDLAAAIKSVVEDVYWDAYAAGAATNPPEWQPIETGPVNEQVLVLCGGQAMVGLQYDEPELTGWDVLTNSGWDDRSSWDDGPHPITHWMPLFPPRKPAANLDPNPLDRGLREAVTEIASDMMRLAGHEGWTDAEKEIAHHYASRLRQHLEPSPPEQPLSDSDPETGTVRHYCDECRRPIKLTTPCKHMIALGYAAPPSATREASEVVSEGVDGSRGGDGPRCSLCEDRGWIQPAGMKSSSCPRCTFHCDECGMFASPPMGGTDPCPKEGCKGRFRPFHRDRARRIATQETTSDPADHDAEPEPKAEAIDPTLEAKQVSAEDVARDAIGLFLEYRDEHGHSEASAKAEAIQETIDANLTLPSSSDSEVVKLTGEVWSVENQHGDVAGITGLEGNDEMDKLLAKFAANHATKLQMVKKGATTHRHIPVEILVKPLNPKGGEDA